MKKEKQRWQKKGEENVKSEEINQNKLDLHHI